jgi:hypothetical protein
LAPVVETSSWSTTTDRTKAAGWLPPDLVSKLVPTPRGIEVPIGGEANIMYIWILIITLGTLLLFLLAHFLEVFCCSRMSRLDQNDDSPGSQGQQEALEMTERHLPGKVLLTYLVFYINFI